MDLELPSQRSCLAYLLPQTFGMLKQGKIIFGLSLKQYSVLKNYKNNKKAHIITTELRTTRIKILKIVQN